jgi:hypothetical protein
MGVWVWPKEHPGAMPVYRLVSPDKKAVLYTAWRGEYDTHLRVHRWKPGTKAFYVYPTPNP